MKEPQIRIYGCGGCGINRTRAISVPTSDAYAEVVKTLVDTSVANVKEDEDLPFFKIPGMNGAGSERIVAHQGANDQIVEMLKTNKPGTVNLVVFSLGGGSGSVIGPLVAAELIKRNCPTICLGVGGISSKAEADNTLKTLKSLEVMSAKKLKKPIVLSYFENTKEDKYPAYTNLGTRTTIDSKLAEVVKKLAMLCSERNRELDRADVSNWLNYTKMCDVPGQLVDLIISSTEERLKSMSNQAISVASLLTGPEVGRPDLAQPYDTYGYYPEFIVDAVEEAKREADQKGQNGVPDLPNLYFALSHVQRNPRKEHLNAVIEAFVETERSLAEAAESGVEDDTEDDGMIF